MVFDIVVNAFDKVSLTTENPFPVLIPSSSFIKNSPNFEVAVSTPSPNDDIEFPLIKFINGFSTEVKACLPISKMENTPLKVVLSFSAAPSLSFNLEVNSFNPSVNPCSCSAVVSGNISRKASFIGEIIESAPFHVFQNELIRSFLPPKSFQPCNNSFLELAELLSISPIVSLTFVKSAFASSKSPTIISQDCVQPDCAASLIVSHNWVNVFTFVAASLAVFPSLSISSTCLSVYPIDFNCSAFKSPVNLDNVSVNIDEVSQPSLRVSLNDPSSLIIWSIFILCTLAVSFRAS